MNKFFSLFIILALFTNSAMIGQEGTGTTAETATAQYPILQNKLKKSDKGLEDPKQNITAKFWLNRADLMLDIYEVNLKYLVVGAQSFMVKLKFGEPKSVTTETKPDGNTYETHHHDQIDITYLNNAVVSWKEIPEKVIYQKPLPEAYKCIDKARELDAEHKLDKKLKEAYLRLATGLVSLGSTEYLDKNYEAAFNDFKSAVDIKLKPIVNTVDTLIMFYTGLAAAKINNTEESIKYYEMALSYNMPEPSLYAQLKQQYFILGDTSKGVKILLSGFDKFPESQEIVVELINYYMSIDRSDDALNYIKIAQQKDPENISLVFAEGTLYDKKGEFEKAENTYKKAISMQPDYFNGYYNLAVMHINRGTQYYKDADKASGNDYKALLEKGDAEYASAREPMEKCMSMLEAQGENISKDDKETLRIVYDTMKQIYLRLKMNDKYEEMKRKLASF